MRYEASAETHGPDVPEYRAYILSSDGHIQSFEPIVCADDEAAITAAERLVDGHDVELWQGARIVKILLSGPKIGT